MVTRFDNAKYWRTQHGEMILISEMETSHLMNTIRMFIRKPYLIASMLIFDIEQNVKNGSDDGVWTPNQCYRADAKKDSIHNATSMNTNQLLDYAFGSPLLNEMLRELNSRGVNVGNMIQMWRHEDDVQLKGAEKDGQP